MVKRDTGSDELGYLDSVGISGPRAALAHCVWVDKEGIARLARQKTNVVHCPSSNLKLGSGVAPIPEMLAAGCPVAIGADGAPCNNRLDAFTEMRLAALIQKPRLGPETLPAAQVPELATLGWARAPCARCVGGDTLPPRRSRVVPREHRRDGRAMGRRRDPGRRGVRPLARHAGLWGRRHTRADTRGRALRPIAMPRTRLAAGRAELPARFPRRKSLSRE